VTQSLSSGGAGAPVVRLATRGSTLARAQARLVAGAIVRAMPSCCVEEVVIRTTGDRIVDRPLRAFGDKAVFVREIEDALRRGLADAGVHSAKDLPVTLPGGLALGAVPGRDDPRDAVITRDGRPLADLPAGARIGTSSLRRRGQLLRLRPEAVCLDVRGNVDTRLAKLDAGMYDALILAVAGLNRLGVTGRPIEVLEPEVMVPAAGQGALAVEVPAVTALGPVWRAIDDAAVRECVEVERLFVRRLGADCHTAVGCLCCREGADLSLRGMVCSPDGRRWLEVTMRGPAGGGAALADAAADDLLRRGAAEILQTARDAAARQ